MKVSMVSVSRRAAVPHLGQFTLTNSGTFSSGEQHEHARGIGAELIGERVGAHHIAPALGHLGAIGDHHALREQAPRRLVVGDHADIAHHLSEEARVNQV